MSILEWQSIYEIGIDELDKDHKQFLEFINHLERHAHSRTAEAEAQEILAKIVKCAMPHFAAEERIMAENRASFTDHHAGLHQEFLEAMGKYLRRLKTDGRIPVQEFLAYLKRWLINHIMREDTKLRKFNTPIKLH